MINNIPGYGLTLHWRGQPNNEAPFMDGVPMVTQCAIPSFTTFQYKFRASAPGTHFYHAFSDRDRNRGLVGALVVREADQTEPHRKLYDEDLKEHVLMLSEWLGADGKVESILINGKGPPSTDNMETFQIMQGKRYRFRIAYVAGTSTCPITLTIQGHLLIVIALDGNPVEPHEVFSISLSKGERLDFVLRATEKPMTYLIKVRSQCQTHTGTALINYKGIHTTPIEVILLKDNDEIFETPLKRQEQQNFLPENLKYLHEINTELKSTEVDHTFYLGYDYKYYENIGIAGKLFIFLKLNHFVIMIYDL